MDKARKRHLRVWKILRPLLAPWIKHKFNLEAQEYTGEGPCLVLANHNTDWDPLLVAMGFPNQMYYVASEHIFRWGIKTKAIVWLLDPISRLKGRSAASAVLAVMRRIRAGASVCIFAEGEKSWNGETCPIADATGKLARSSGAALVTYRLEGGYFTHPRWADSHRRGKMRGVVAGVYPAEQLRKMKPEEINAIIRRDLYENAYDRQAEQKVAFRGKGMAEGLERALCYCPECGAIETMKSEGNRFYCTACSFKTEYTPEGYFTNGRFKTVYEWDAWQRELIEKRASEAADDAVYEDDGFELLTFTDSHDTVSLGRGGFALYRDRIVCCGETWPLEEIGGMALHGNQKLNISVGERDFEVVPLKTHCTRKYLIAYETIKRQKEQAEAADAT